MTIVAARTFALTPWPFDGLAWVEVPPGLEFTYWNVTTIAWSGWVVPAEPGDEHRWTAAAQAFETALRDAQSDVRHAHGVRTKPGFMVDVRTVRQRRHDLVPGRTRRSREAFAHCAARMHAADAAYRPVRDEIDTLIATHGRKADPAVDG